MRVSIPIEVSQREFLSKLYLSIKLAKEGHNIYIGNGVSYGHDIIRPDLILSKFNVSNLTNNSKHDTKVILLDSEGGLIGHSVDEYKKRISPDRNFTFDYYFAWNKTSAGIVDNLYDDVKTVVTGNPRFDLLQPQVRVFFKETRELMRERFGRYILINTSFSDVNNINCRDTPYNFYDIDSDKYKYRKRLFLEFLDLITFLCHNGINIVVRPHPVENLSPYQDLNKKNNLHIISTGTAADLICGASSVIHKNSTSGIEAAIMNKNVYSYNGGVEPVPYNEAPVPDRLSIQKTHKNNILKELKSDLENDKSKYSLNDKQQSILKKHINNIQYESTNKIVEVIDSIPTETNKRNITDTPSIKQLMKRNIYYLFGSKSIHEIQKRGIKFISTNNSRTNPHKSINEVERMINRFSNVVNVSEVNVDRVKKLYNSFRISNQS